MKELKLDIFHLFFLFLFEMDKNTCPKCGIKSEKGIGHYFDELPPPIDNPNPCKPFCPKIRIKEDNCTWKCDVCNIITPQDCSEKDHRFHYQHMVTCRTPKCRPNEFCKVCKEPGFYSQFHPVCKKCERQAIDEFVEKHNK